MAKRKIRILNAVFRNASVKIGTEAITQVSISAPFDELIADALMVKSIIYRRRQDEDEPEITDYELRAELYGAGLVIRVKQQELDFTGKKKPQAQDGGDEFESLSVESFHIRRPKDDEQRLISFKVSLLDEDGRMYGLIRTFKKQPFDLDILPPSKKASADAEEKARQAGLFGKPKATGDEEGEEAEESVQ